MHQSFESNREKHHYKLSGEGIYITQGMGHRSVAVNNPWDSSGWTRGRSLAVSTSVSVWGLHTSEKGDASWVSGSKDWSPAQVSTKAGENSGLPCKTSWPVLRKIPRAALQSHMKVPMLSENVNLTPLAYDSRVIWAGFWHQHPGAPYMTAEM